MYVYEDSNQIHSMLSGRRQRQIPLQIPQIPKLKHLKRSKESYHVHFNTCSHKDKSAFRPSSKRMPSFC